MTQMRLLFHVHTRQSLDAWIVPGAIVRHARENGIGMVIVTDHDSHLGSVACGAIGSGGSIRFPMSAEYKSTAGDIICAFLEHPIRTREPLGIVEETHAQGGLVIIPHPFKNSRFSDSVLEAADLIEIFNSRCTDEQNARAAAAARDLAKPGLAGADAHLRSELGLAVNEFDVSGTQDWRSVILTAPRTFTTTKTTLRAIRRSQMISACRQAKPIMFAKNLVRWVQASPSATP